MLHRSKSLCRGTNTNGPIQRPFFKIELAGPTGATLKQKGQWSGPLVLYRLHAELVGQDAMPPAVVLLSDDAICQAAEHCWDPVGHAIVRYGYLFKGLIQARQRE